MARRKHPIFGLLICIPIIVFAACSLGQAAVVDRTARTSVLPELLRSMQGTPGQSAPIIRADNGYVRFLMAPPSAYFPANPANRAAPEEAAGAFLRQWPSLLVNDTPRVRFEVKRVSTSGDRAYVRYQQKYAGLEVFGAEVVIQVNAGTRVVAVIADTMRDTRELDEGVVSIQPTLDGATAQEKATATLAKEHGGIALSAKGARLMVFCPCVVGKSGRTQLVWQTDVSNPGQSVVSESVLVDAHNGEMVFHYSLICDADGVVERRLIDWAENLNYIYTENDPPPAPGEAADAWLYMEDFYDFYWSIHSRDSYDGNGGFMDGIVNMTLVQGYAKWVGGINRIEVQAEYVADDLIGHEFTHGVTWSDDASGLHYEGESGAINESFSDMWGEWIDLGNGHGNDSSSVAWLFGEDVPNGPFRSMKDPPDYETWYGGPMPDRYNSPNFYTGGSDQGGVHHNCGVGNKLCYLLTDGDTFNGYTISATGMPPELFYECQVHLLTDSADYHDLGNVLQLAAVNVGLSEADRLNVENACRAVEIYDADISFSTRDSAGVPRAWIDDLGNLYLGGTLTESTTPSAGGGDEFRVQNANANDVAIIDATTGDMAISGTKHEDCTDMSSASNFIVKNGAGVVVAYIDAGGGLYLKGKAYTSP